MKHTILITVSGLKFEAIAVIGHTAKGRDLERVTCANPPADILAALSSTVMDLNDVLFVAGEYLSLTGKPSFSFSCGATDFDVSIVSPESYFMDLNNRTVMARVVDCQENVHLFDVGAPNSFEALAMIKDALRIPVRSASFQPLEVI